MKSQVIVLIPARFDSSRFPGKVLVPINGKAMVLHVLEKALAVFNNVFVATDDKRIAEVVESDGGQAILTGHHHLSGTDRCAEAIEKVSMNLESEAIVINLQGDEPYIPSELITQLAAVFQNRDIEIATLIHPISTEKDVMNPNRVKVALDKYNNALYFSRSPIPYIKKFDPETDQCWFRHIGIYGFRYSVLKEIVTLSQGRLEQKESLEQLRWLENGYKIHCIETDYDGFGIDTPEDLEEALLRS
ncbi:MAG: 3-deoxy-manno-octulosonate cytidylyltransferase [Bacteroidota bacterium]|nr:3-deoxy-manno-octulosonate cytidylyltransferase [Bacteroidota bacterium]